MKKYLAKQLLFVRSKSKQYLLTLSLFLTTLQAQAVFADDPFAKTENLANQGISKVQGIGIVCFGFAAVVTGLVYGFGGRELKAKIKSHWLAIAIAIFAVSAGPSIVEWFFNFVKGG
ncbi:conjugal transfer protein TrbC [Streptococcus agalactiae]|uniref:TrbC/VirB2 family protein n=1 Tax=Streptococcus agalactiae TaxID=1311 RepID=UPI001374D95F|nr:TrbC/VirB2 family protein [Streptococcus agalactiae]KAF1260950.1 conjugal transfer protein TrbC [Streptococcus agalactiae]KAF1271399.1 conjugal transfer protein TrbC [Streptococcus agalactiae]HEN0543785.1 conjugal transfer protein TrbC [Streptococcus agalactiae]HEO6299849.1 conjugal transfer protein TrbC [Streptococcus agalactiae]